MEEAQIDEEQDGMHQGDSEARPESEFSFDDLIALSKEEEAAIDAKYKDLRWSRVYSLQLRYMDPGFTVPIANDLKAFRKKEAGTSSKPFHLWQPVFDPNDFYKTLEKPKLEERRLGEEELLDLAKRVTSLRKAIRWRADCYKEQDVDDDLLEPGSSNPKKGQIGTRNRNPDELTAT